MDGFTFKTKARMNGNSMALTLRKEVTEYLGVEVGDTIEMGVYKGKKGKFIAIWKKEE